MAYDEDLAQNVRMILSNQKGMSEKKMFGGLAFLINGNMSCGILGMDLIVRVGPDHYQDYLKLPKVRKFDITGREMRGWVMVACTEKESNEVIKKWVKRGQAFALTLPPK